MPRANDDKSNDLHVALAGLGLAGTILMVTIVGALRLAQAMGPRIGDIIAFDPTRTVSSDDQTAIKVTPLLRPARGACILDPHVMAQAGGSFMIEATSAGAGRGYRLRWAGSHTSDGPTDCGSTGVFLLSHTDVVKLKLSSGH
ncbi:hypothetical protein [Acidisphaera sp. S103]|uniref:hypothetical protein n=1 Tax=Acidisphaera sp. S103 TaxID=1747223 RepID=UPI00131D423F|nr:hypothetical protein [Acidisphaera sp. S103]